MIEHEARDEGRRVGEFETTLALAEALGLPPETRIGPALAEVRKLRAERDALRATVRALIDALPRCDSCQAPATRAYGRGGGRYCDEHPGGAPDYPRAAPIRALLALLPPEDP